MELHTTSLFTLTENFPMSQVRILNCNNVQLIKSDASLRESIVEKEALFTTFLQPQGGNPLFCSLQNITDCRYHLILKNCLTFAVHNDVYLQGKVSIIRKASSKVFIILNNI